MRGSHAYVIIHVMFVNLCTTEVNGSNIFFIFIIGDCEDYHDAITMIQE